MSSLTRTTDAAAGARPTLGSACGAVVEGSLDQVSKSPGTFDANADAAYFPVAGRVGAGESVESVVIERSTGTVILDFNPEGRLLGVEVLGARSLLTTSTIEDLSTFH